MEGRLEHICISDRKGRAKTALPSVVLIEEYGLEGDCHTGKWHRQVSLLDCADIDAMRRLGVELKAGAFGENLGTSGIDLDRLGIGTILEFGSPGNGARIEFTQIGKTCHQRCAIYYTAGDCIMPRAGMFGRVIQGGEIHTGEAVRVIREVPRETWQAAVLTVSDRCSRGEATDTSGPAVAGLLKERLAAHIAWDGVVADDEEQIAELLNHLSDRGLNLIVTTGGTGFAPRDVTPEATRRVIEKEVPGFAEEMRRRSAQITPNALSQRGISGIRGRSLIINLPGSEKGAVENLGFIVDALPHALKHLRDEPSAPEPARRKDHANGNPKLRARRIEQTP